MLFPIRDSSRNSSAARRRGSLVPHPTGKRSLAKVRGEAHLRGFGPPTENAQLGRTEKTETRWLRRLSSLSFGRAMPVAPRAACPGGQGEAPCKSFSWKENTTC